MRKDTTDVLLAQAELQTGAAANQLESRRLQILAEYGILDTSPEVEFDRLVGLAAKLFSVPIVLVSLVDRDRQFFKANIGLDVCQTSRDVSFCAHAIASEDILFIPDASLDPRFWANRLVTGEPHIRFYAGKPLITPTGERLGTLCLIDTKPRGILTSQERAALADIAALVMDRLELRRLESLRKSNQARFENIAATSPDAIICSDTRGQITFWNAAAHKLFGYSVEEVSHLCGDAIVADSWLDRYNAELRRLDRGEPMELAKRTLELPARRKDGTEFPAEFSLSTWSQGGIKNVGAIVRDVSDRRANEERLFRLASLDALTQLPNRSAWRARLNEMLFARHPATVLLLDLDGFKDINDTSGHFAGDTVLKMVAERFRLACPDAVCIARLGGDEFVALISGDDAVRAKAAGDAVKASVAGSYVVADHVFDVDLSVGIALSPGHGTRAEDILGAADLAMYRAKSKGHGRVEMFAPALRQMAIARRALAQELRAAFETNQFEMFYQPQVDTSSRVIKGAEALIRWKHPERGLLSPASFIEVLSEKPSAAAVGEWTLRAACAQAAQWRALVPDFRVGVNLFEAQFRSDQFLTVVRDALEESELPPEALELEIVENILLRNDRSILPLLHGIREMGVGLAFDDYGTGFASLSLLKNYPVSRLKIDRSFIQEINSDNGDAAVVKAILYLGKSFDMDVIAEGVETEAQLQFLRRNGCREVQGYLFGKPVPSTDFQATWLSNRVTA